MSVRWISPELWPHEADEMFVTSTAGGPMPVTELNGQPVGEGAVAVSRGL